MSQQAEKETQARMKTTVLRGKVVGKDNKPFLETTVKVLKDNKWEDKALLIPVTLTDSDKEILRQWYKEKKGNSSFMKVKFDMDKADDAASYTQLGNVSVCTENVKARRAFYHYFVSEKGERPEAYLSVRSLPSNKKEEITALVEKNTHAKVSAFICYVDKDEKGKQIFYPIKGAACSPNRVKDESVEDYMKRLDEKIKTITANLAKSGLKGKPLGIFYSMESVYRLDTYPNAEAKEMNGFGKYIVEKTIPQQNENREKYGKPLFYGDVLYTESEKGNIFINKNFPIGLRIASTVMSFKVKEITEAKKKELGIDEAEAYLENEKNNYVASERNENFETYNREEIETVICDDAEEVTENLVDDEDMDGSPFGPSM